MPIFTKSDWVSVLRRISFWFISFILGVTLFSLFFGSMMGSGMGSVAFVFRITMMFAFPVWCLYLPFIYFLTDAGGQRSAILLLSGILIGPAALAVWGLIHLPVGEDLFHGFWNGDPEEGMGMGYIMVFASVVGFLTSAIYVLFLKFAHLRHTAAKSV